MRSSVRGFNTGFSAKREAAGFTLIELLVVVTIISILTLIGFAVYSGIQSKARDGLRKADLGSIRHALEFYYQKNGHFPCAPDWQNSSFIWNDMWIWEECVGAGGPSSLDSNYIKKTPSDPKINDGYPWSVDQYSYAYWAGDTTSTSPSCQYKTGQYYILVAKLENENDSENAGHKDYYYCDNSTKITEVINVGSNLLPSGGDQDKLYFVTSQTGQ
jgi:prepilin-type N-terminal cleavage/methylation domain-containing protein